MSSIKDMHSFYRKFKSENHVIINSMRFAHKKPVLVPVHTEDLCQ